jgi:hypothetical protein
MKVEVIGGWRKLHNEELVLFTKYNWNDEIEGTRWAGHVA